LTVVEQFTAVQRGFRLFAGTEMAPGSPLSNRPLKCATMPQAVGLLRRGRMVFDPEVAAQQIEFALAGGSAFAQTEPAVGEPLAARHATRPDGAFNGSLRKSGPDGPGRDVAHALAERAQGLGWALAILDPRAGRDWNDILTGTAVAA